MFNKPVSQSFKKSVIPKSLRHLHEKKMCLVKGAQIAEVARLSYDLEPSTRRFPTIKHSVNPAPTCVPVCT